MRIRLQFDRLYKPGSDKMLILERVEAEKKKAVGRRKKEEEKAPNN